MRLTAEQVARDLRDCQASFASLGSHEIAKAYDDSARYVESNLIEPPDERRERFERWHIERYGDGCNHLLSHDGVAYTDVQTNLMWLAWSASQDFRGDA